MSLILDNCITTEYTVVTTYEDGHRAYSVWMHDIEVAIDFKRRMKFGLFGPTRVKVKSIDIMERTTTVKERIID